MSKCNRLLVLILLGVSALAARAEGWIGFEVPEGASASIEQGEPVPEASDLQRFLDAADATPPIITDIYISRYYGVPETELIRSYSYQFNVRLGGDGICTPYLLEYGFFNDRGEMVYMVDHVEESYGVTPWCNIIGTGIPIIVPTNAPLGDYTWGVRVTTSAGTDVFYPSSFTIVP